MTRPSRRAVRLHVLRGTIAAGMALTFFWGLARVPMAQAIALAYIAPLLALLLGAVVLHERVGPRVAVASFAALAGVGIILVGQSRAALGPEAFEGAVAVLISAVLYALNLIVARLQSQAARPGEIAFFQSTVVMLILALGAPWFALFTPPDEWQKIMVAAVLATASLYLLAWAYAHGEAGYLATTEYTSFVYAAVLGWLVCGELVSLFTLTGAGVIVAACLYAARRRDIAQSAIEAAA